MHILLFIGWIKGSVMDRRVTGEISSNFFSFDDAGSFKNKC
jgi:hypothetical protein